MNGRKSPPSQIGMALFFCLIFLTALTLLGLSASADVILQNQLVANYQEAERARQSALAALSWAEDWLFDLEGTVPDYCEKPCAGLFVHSPGDLPTHPEYESLSWWLDHGYLTGIDPLTGEHTVGGAPGNTNNSVWLIEELHSVSRVTDDPEALQVWYRILARGSGRSKGAISVVESIVARSWLSTREPAPSDTEVSSYCSGLDSSAQCGRVSWRELR